MPADLDALMHAAVGGVGGSDRPGQQQMARAVDQAARDGSHLLVQAGTGTGKSLAYLVPAIRHAVETGQPAIVATATLALQAQIVDRDLPRIADALAPELGRRPTYGLVKGRRNYLCLHKIEGGYPDDEDSLLDVGEVDRAAGRIGEEVVRLREWAQETDSGERDELVPGVSERAWRQVSVSAEECLGSKCPMVQECFVERSRAAAKDVDVVVTNHSFMAIDSFEGRQMLPEHDLLVVDEAHELVDRVTSTITDEVTGGMIATAARRCGRMADASTMREAGEMLQELLGGVQEGRLLGIPDNLALALTRVRDAARSVQSELKPASPADNDASRQVARAAIDEIFDNCDRILEGRELDVVWVSQDQRRGAILRVAPMSVAMLLREKVFGDRTVIMTSATLELGGSFDSVAGTLGLRGDGGPKWTGLDVGSPFDYPRQAIAYVASQLPPPGRDGMSTQAMDEIETLVRAAGGRTLGLFSSTRAARAAAEEMRTRFGDEIPVLCQGDDQIRTLVGQFAADPRTCLFGTLTLWQGVDVPGPSCQLVIIDRIPFPRPDDPLASARSQEIARRGGNGFMSVSATHAALRLAQGAGRLVRNHDDRGVVAFLDTRMITARYAGFLQKSLPPFWPTTDRALVLKALRRLDETAADRSAPIDAEQVEQASVEAAETAADVVHDAPAELAPQPDRQVETVAAEPEPEPEPEPAAIAAASSPPAPASAVDTEGVAPPAGGWSPEDDEELRDGADLGLAPEELAEHLDRPLEEVRNRLVQLRIG
ncbi:ATP-dependent DNA helicase DinG [Flexivirga endophytica]|uniref:ATP-dependent helicase DinG n=1 Tax=Flexivirga endophytica TaxID=1849103 RepID=A0A916SWM1_9MICO|nr:ATP-dependent DNA helicase [Flexivirga endophytica]GGB17612.1 ATP-dependent DNA helicase DinG [Flexivirga endophytica]GHB38030.1 ATP-dependent DNA helicase DinG [Flexivirga endophytica]